jgi:hypothetical protein
MTEAPEKIWVHYERETDDAVWSEYPYNDGVEDFTHYGEYTRSDIAAQAALTLADKMLELEAEVKRLREALMLITVAYDPKDYGGNSEVMFSIAGAALQSHGEANQ